MGVDEGICCTQLCNRILFYFSFLRGRLYFAFGFDRCVGGDPIPQGFSPWNLGHFLLVQKVTKDTPRGEGFRFISAPRASLRSVALRNAPAGAAPLPWEPLFYRQRQGLRPFSLIFSRGCNGEKFPHKTIEKDQLRSNRMRPKAAERRNRHNAHRKRTPNAPAECGPKGRRAPY